MGVAYYQVGLGFSVPNSPRTTSQVGCKSPLWAISLMITPACLYTFGSVYWVLSMGHIHRTPHLDHVVLFSVTSSSQCSVRLSAFTIYHYIRYSVSTCYKLVIASSYLRTKHITFRLLYLLLCFFSYVLFQVYSILHAQYLSGTDTYLHYIFS